MIILRIKNRPNYVQVRNNYYSVSRDLGTCILLVFDVADTAK